jgi:dihydroorotate dehydrogenase
MKLRGIEFGHVWDAAGARGWFGEGHAFHPAVRPFGLRFDGSTFVAKTTTLNARRGNASMRPDGMTPRVFPQRAVEVRWFKGVVLNAFGLPGPGVRALLAAGKWQRIESPFFLSFMATEGSREESLNEVREFVRVLKDAASGFSAPFGLQVNFSCPNVPLYDDLRHFKEQLDEYQTLGIPIVVKLSATTPVGSALEIASHRACDGICVSNSIPWGAFPDGIEWIRLFGRESPLKAFGGGGLSGKPLLPIVADWVREAVASGLQKPINAGGGILKPRDVDVLVNAGARSVFVGSVAMLRGWRLQRIIRHANQLLAGLETRGTVPPVRAVRRA